jgi:hypothetical protein
MKTDVEKGKIMNGKIVEPKESNGDGMQPLSLDPSPLIPLPVGRGEGGGPPRPHPLDNLGRGGTRPYQV